jgi:ADP-ribose pyrophosphatase
MKKKVRNAVRCFILTNNQVVCIKYLKGRIGYYDIPGGKIEENETPIQTVLRECYEETGLSVKNPKFKGIMNVECPNIIYNFKVFVVNDYVGEPQIFEENISKWIKIEELNLKKRKFANTVLLEKNNINLLLNEEKIFEIFIKCDSEDNIFELTTKLIERK